MSWKKYLRRFRDNGEYGDRFLSGQACRCWKDSLLPRLCECILVVVVHTQPVWNSFFEKMSREQIWRTKNLLARGVSLCTGKLVIVEAYIGVWVVVMESTASVSWMFRTGSTKLRRKLKSRGRRCLAEKCDQIVKTLIRGAVIKVRAGMTSISCGSWILRKIKVCSSRYKLLWKCGSVFVQICALEQSWGLWYVAKSISKLSEKMRVNISFLSSWLWNWLFVTFFHCEIRQFCTSLSYETMFLMYWSMPSIVVLDKGRFLGNLFDFAYKRSEKYW